jgi:hypothetical protein
MIAPQDSIRTTLYDEFSSQLLEDALLQLHPKVWKGYVKADTLHPGECYIMPFPEDSVREVGIGPDLQEIASHKFFTDRDYLQPTSLPYRSLGVAGDPIPYTVRGDNSLTILLLLCFVLFVVSLAHSKHILAKQLKDLFWPTGHDNDNSEGGGELRFMVFLSLVNALVLAISTYLLASDIVGQNIIVGSGVMIIAYLFASFTAYYCLKWLLATIVNLTFFGVKKNLQWMTLQLQVTALQGVLLFPILALQIYFEFSAKNVLLYIGLVLILNKILTFFKSYQIFFSRNGLYLQTFLYFCSLEIAPMLALGGAGQAIIDSIKINF